MIRKHAEHLFSRRLSSGRIEAFDKRAGVTEFLNTDAELAAWIRERSRSEEHYPIGSAVHDLLEAVGVKGCLPCAERQAKLDRLVRRRRGW